VVIEIATQFTYLPCTSAEHLKEEGKKSENKLSDAISSLKTR